MSVNWLVCLVAGSFEVTMFEKCSAGIPSCCCLTRSQAVRAESSGDGGSHVDNVIQADKLVHTTIYELKHVY